MFYGRIQQSMGDGHQLKFEQQFLMSQHIF